MKNEWRLCIKNVKHMCKTNENYVYKTGSEKPSRRYDEMADKECTHILLIHVDFQ